MNKIKKGIIKCWFCKAEVSRGEKFCPSCKVEMPTKDYAREPHNEELECSTYGATVKVNDRVCPKDVAEACGQRIGQPPPRKIGEYGGIGRLGYWIGSVLCLGGSFLFSAGGPKSAFFGLVVVLIAHTAIMFQRLKNIGWNGWLALLNFIPLVNLAVSIPSAICPEGYAATKKLDRTGRILAGVLVGCIVLLVGALLIPALLK